MIETATVPVKGKLPARAWLIVILLSIVGCLNYLDRTMITTMRESIITAIPMTDAQFGLLTSSFLWVYGLLSPFAGFLADRFNRSRVIICSLFLWSLVTWMTAYTTSFEGLLTTRILMGVSEACYIPAALALIMDYHRTNTRSLATGIHMVGIMCGSGMGFVGGWLAEKHHWSTSFIVLGIVGSIYAVMLAYILRDLPRQKEEVVVGAPLEDKINFLVALKELFRLRSFNLMLGAWGLLGTVSWLVVGWLPTYLRENFHLTQSMAGVYATGFYYPAALIGLLLGGYWADRWSRTNPRARLLVPIIGLSIGVPCIFLASSTGFLAIAVGSFMLFSLTKAFIDTNMMPILSMAANPRYLATGYGILNLVSCIIGGIGLYAGGILRDAQINLSNIFQVAALVMVAGIVLLALVRPRATGLEN